MTKTTLGEIQNRKTVFTPSDRNAIYYEIVMKEEPKIDSVFDLYRFLQAEKERIYRVMVKGDSLDRLVLEPELIDINNEIRDIEEYFKQLTKQQNN